MTERDISFDQFIGGYGVESIATGARLAESAVEGCSEALFFSDKGFTTVTGTNLWLYNCKTSGGYALAKYRR